MKQPSVKYAVIALAITAVWILIEHFAGWNSTRHDIGQYTRMLPMILFWVLIFVTVNQTRAGKIPFTFTEGFRAGLIMSLIYCAGFTLLIVLYQKLINPDFFDTLKAWSIEQMHAKNIPQEQIDAELKNMEMSFNGSAVSFFLLFVFSFGWGTILSAIAALVYRKK